jgi:hypothetical protein
MGLNEGDSSEMLSASPSREALAQALHVDDLRFFITEA